ncbi:hypothetical protein BT96DRAFT_998407 [Gymnopus androsaceus JB14]|uniref:PH domain-containing protein n=1 Tax=Gymnopus androsaceus JB14 TaxID=1447944 RepID=A0A6A4HBE3_9AGAR|nr:hypothetical protein BT96DRAFT_998407 [Gymnopus androsaceus JB14]
MEPTFKTFPLTARWKRENTVYLKQTEEEQEQWLSGCQEQHQINSQYFFECTSWDENRGASLEKEPADAREQRYESIRKKLAQAGWQEELSKLSLWNRLEHKLVAQSKPVTE